MVCLLVFLTMLCSEQFLATHWILKAARQDVRGGGRGAGQVVPKGLSRWPAWALLLCGLSRGPLGPLGTAGPLGRPAAPHAARPALCVLSRPLSSPVCLTSASGNSCHRTGIGHSRTVDATGRGACALCPQSGVVLLKRV